MAWSVLTWKILRISQSQFLFGEVRAETRHSSYTKTLWASFEQQTAEKKPIKKIKIENNSSECGKP